MTDIRRTLEELFPSSNATFVTNLVNYETKNFTEK